MPHDRGESLIELLISVTLLTTAVVGLLTGLSGLGRNSGLHREQVQARAYLLQAADLVKAAGYKASCSEYDLSAVVPATSEVYAPAVASCAADSVKVVGKMRVVTVTVPWKTPPQFESMAVGVRTP